MAELLQRRLPDDVLEYLLIPCLPNGLEENEYIPLLEEVCDTYLGFLGPLAIDYIWQNEGLNLRLVPAKGEIPAHLCGTTHFGDNIEDEWFIVHLLYELSRQFPDLVIRASDNDEEFMLIEAADHLPAWLNPETAEKRVYIHGGELHVVPIPQSPNEVSTYPLFTPTIEEAVTLVRNPDINTRAVQPIQDALNARLNRCQMKMEENKHYANVYVPVTVAALLKERPALVSAAVQAFYYRDPVELKVCRTMNHFKPENMVVTRVRFTHCLYAQLLQQKFKPDKRSGWMLPSASNPKFKEYDLGVKLSHGFEILCARCKSNTNGSASGSGSSHNMSEVRWARFLKSLQDKGYFKGELEGSQAYNKLLDDAKGFFQSQVTDVHQSGSDVAREIVLMLPSLSTDVGPWKQLEKTLPPSDDDSWLNLTQEALEEMMRSATGNKGGTVSEDLDLQKVADHMTAFVEKVSSTEGVEFPSPTKEGGDGEREGVELDETSFIHAMQKMFEFKDDEDGSSSDMSEYDWEENSDEDLGSPTKMPGTRPAVPAQRHTHSRSPPKMKSSHSADNPPTPSTKPTQPTDPPSSSVKASISFEGPPKHSGNLPRPTAKPPARPSKPPAVPPKPPSRPSKPASRRKDPEIVAIMDAMDRELAQTEVGKSFEREPPKPKPPKFQPKAREPNGRHTDCSAKPSPNSGPSKLVSRPAKPPPSRPSRPPPPVPPRPSPSAPGVDIDEEDDDFRPVNIDMNVVKNTLESFKAQQGLPGPVSNILQSMGIALPPDADGEPSQ
ncbi:protein ecdysoneless homolog [Babylonia areolata]|uniref:protein ecdysoneless homolog n=1 Tax=Babylonia areolata TaxID=304850 RepID=UPI003FD17232